MSLPHVPVRIIAADPAEMQAFADALGGGQTGAVALAAAGEKPVVALVCPSGVPDADSAGLPMVVLGARREGVGREGVGADARILPVPTTLAEVLDAVELLASATAGLGAPRHCEGWTLDPVRLTLRLPDGRSVQLTETESRLLACLFDAEGAVVARDVLLQRVWGYRPGLDTHTLETHIYRLRKKLEIDTANPSIIVTDADGYRFAAVRASF